MAGNPGLNLDGTPVNRYLDLINEIPRGEFYRVDGTRVPYRGSSATPLLIQTSQPVRTFGIFVNDKFVGEVTTDSDGFARFSVVLDLGRNDIVLEDDVTAQRIRTYLTALVMHTWHASLAESIEAIDENIQSTLDARRIEAVTARDAEDMWGRRLLSPNTPAYQHEAYRELLQEVHQAYRIGGGRRLGLDDVVGAYATARPLAFEYRTFGPRWALGTSFLRDAQFQERNRQQFTRASDIPGVLSIDSIGPANQTGAGTISSVAAPPRLTWTPPGLGAGALVDVTGGGQFTLPGPALIARFDGRTNGTFAIVAATNDALRLNVDGLGSLDITLTAGGARTAAQVVADINAAFVADTRYGVPYGAVASVIATTRVRLSSVVAGASGSVVLENIAADAYFTVFGYPWTRTTILLGELAGATAVECVATDGFPQADANSGFDALMARNTVREEVINIVANDTTTDTLTTAVGGLALAKAIGDTVEVNGAFPYAQYGSDNDETEQGIVVTVDDALIPGAPDTETVTLAGSDVPDEWLVDNATASLEPYGFFDFRQLVLTNDGTGDTTIQADADERAFQYLEWPFTFSVWVRNPSAAAISVRLGVDFGTGFTEAGAVAVPPTSADGGDAMQYVSFDVVPPATATAFRCRIRQDGAVVGDTLEVARASLRQPNVTALSLGINTTPRSDHRGWLGELIYIWSPVVLTARENELIGLASPTTRGHVDFVLPAHVQGDRFDVSEYAGAVPKNLRGSFSEIELLAGVATNMLLTVRTPARRSFMKPSRVSLVSGEALTFPVPPVPPFTATLAIESNEDQNEALLFEDGVLVPNDRWQFNSSTEVEVTSGYNSGASYAIDYQALIRYESPVIDLMATFGDYVWYADAHDWSRREPTLAIVQRTVQVDFNQQTLLAGLADRSDLDRSATTLVENNGLSVRTVPVSGYRYIDSRTVQIDSNQFKTSALYFLTFNSLRVSPVLVPDLTIEYRRAASIIALLAETYVEIQKDAVLPATGRYLQYRCTVNNILDLRDFRLYSVSARGLNLFGTSGTVPIIRT